jgi:MoxR-like ATPase
MILTPEEKSIARAALLKAGIKTRRLSDVEISVAYAAQTGTRLRDGTPAPAPAPAPAPTTTTTTTVTTPEDHVMTTPASTAAALAEKIAAMIIEQQPAAPALDEARIIELIEQHATKSLAVSTNDNEPIRIEGAHPALERVVTWLSTRSNVYLVGPAGSGKTTLAEQAAEALDLPFYSSGAVMASYELLGFRDAHGQYTPSPLRTCYENGGVFLLDELDACSAKALICFNQLLANGSFTFPDGMIQRHADFVVIGGGNTVGTGATRQYIGRNPLDGASLDRFVQIEITYDEPLEYRLAKAEFSANGGTDINLLQRWITVVQSVRTQLAGMKSTAIVSPRASMFGARGLAKGLAIDSMVPELLTATLTADQIAQLRINL